VMPFNIGYVRTRLPGREIYFIETIDTTMREAAVMAASGCASGTAIIADVQTAGQGRHGHTWHSPKGAGLYTSVVLHPELRSASLPPLTLALGLATAEAIARATGVECDLRWPNDVMINDRKVAGILVQLVDGAVVAGIGINVNHTRFPSDIEGLATSLRIESGREHSREELFVHLLELIDSFCRMLTGGGRQAIFDLFERRSSYVRHKRVVVRQGDTELTGVTAGLDEGGCLILHRDDGTKHLILAGGVRAADIGRG
ncbi:MAG: biotin--[acetyl-CoA-carboxylase] ligase, partial [Bryobacteraceae bacterium]